MSTRRVVTVLSIILPKPDCRRGKRKNFLFFFWGVSFPRSSSLENMGWEQKCGKESKDGKQFSENKGRVPTRTPSRIEPKRSLIRKSRNTSKKSNFKRIKMGNKGEQNVRHAQRSSYCAPSLDSCRTSRGSPT